MRQDEQREEQRAAWETAHLNKVRAEMEALRWDPSNAMSRMLQRLEQRSQGIWETAQKENPGDLEAAKAQASKALRTQYNGEFASRSWPDEARKHFDLNKEVTFREPKKEQERQPAARQVDVMREAERRAMETRRDQDRERKRKDRDFGL